ncbi:MAG: hypothetical protein EA370_03315 [Wenzhouxiangella sp.]|nr:MAG: hypothetical protein EA370_03315 [Wenzhouxiangella sp.]
MPLPRLPLLAALFFVSGFAALVYQVLWVRQLGLLLGSTAQAAALAIAIFFAGIALGGWFWGRRAKRFRSCLAAFGWLEIGVAATALGHFILLDAYGLIYPVLFGLVEGLPGGDLLLKLGLAALVLLPPAILMGGTLPVLGHELIRRPRDLGRLGSLLYAVNTAGAAAGALAAGFMLPLWLGFSGAYLMAVGLDLLVGLIALWLARNQVLPAAAPASTVIEKPSPTDDSASVGVWTLAFVSGFVALGVEVLWTRLFAQVLQNSIYTYSLVLVVFLLALTLGAVLANRLCRLRTVDTRWIMTLLLISAGVLVALTPFVFHALTGGLDYVAAGRPFHEYLLRVAAVALAVMLVPGLALGTILPYLLRGLEQSRASTGELLGRLIAVNTTGAIAGALVSGFVLLPLLGATRTLLVLAAVYLTVAAALLASSGAGRLRLAGAAISVLIAGMLAFLPLGNLQPLRLNAAANERLVAMVEGAHATVAVIERDRHQLIRVNNHYTLGGTGALESERNQALIPMLIHPDPREVFFLGMGTGITAGAALLFPVERVEVCEILPEVVSLARAHFRPWTEGLFDDPRVTIHAEDGRNCLRRSRQRYDLIISDLFTPWEAGTGNLYTLEHFRTASTRLKPGGLFVQWLPTYQVSEREFAIIARTMDEVFDQVVLWRGDLFPAQSIVALVGQNEARPLDPAVPVRHGRELAGNPSLPADLLEAVALRFYAGNITASGLFAEAAINTDNRALIEYLAPRTQREVQAGRARWLTGDQLGLLYERLLRNPGLANDPYLARLTDAQLGYVVAGRSYFHHGVYRLAGETERAALFLEDFLARTPFEVPPPEMEPPQTLSGWEESRADHGRARSPQQ